MNLTDALLRSVPMSLAAALSAGAFVALGKWRNKPLGAAPEHALWTCVLAAMLLLPLPKVTVYAGAPVLTPVVWTGAQASPGSPVVPVQKSMPGPAAPALRWSPLLPVVWSLGTAWMFFRILAGIFFTRRSLAGAGTIRDVLPAGESHVAEVVESDNAAVPMTIGWPFARIVLPLEWRKWPDDKLRAVMLHELGHVRRRDTLVTFLAAVNKAIFWFHPLAWWLERRLAELAEFAADDEAKGRINPHDYAAFLVEIASSARPERLHVHAASADFARHGAARINRRVERIFDSTNRYGSMRIVWVAGAIIAVFSMVQFERPVRAQVPAGPATAQAVPGPAIPVQPGPTKPNALRQSPGPRLTFEAASVRPVPADGSARYFITGIAGSPDPGRFHYGNCSLKTLLHDAYNVEFFQLDGPGWIDSETFDIQATMPPDTTKEQLAEMLQSLLSDRFHLKVHHEVRELPIYSLSVAKGGPKVKESQETGAVEDDFIPEHPRATGSMDADGIPMIRLGHPGIAVIMGPYSRVIVKAQTMSQFADRLSFPMGRKVRDATGLTAKYDFTLNFANEGRGPQPEFDAAPDVRVALQEQLGLRLEPGKGPVAVIVVDHIEKTPTDN